METNITEIWKDVVGFEGVYQVSNIGNVKSFKPAKNGRLLKPFITGGKYLTVSLSNSNVKSASLMIHRLMADAFLGVDNRPFMVVDHINNNSKDNRIENLQRITKRLNCTKDAKRESRYVGVTRSRKVWVAQIAINGKNIKLGTRSTEIEAHELYQSALNKLNNG